MTFSFVCLLVNGGFFSSTGEPLSWGAFAEEYRGTPCEGSTCRWNLIL